MQRRYPIYPPLDLVREVFVQVLDDIELHILPAVARKAVDAVQVADSLQRVDEQHYRFLFHIDYPLVRAAHRLPATGSQPHHILHRIVRRIPIVGVLFVIVYRLRGGRAGVQQKRHRDIPLHLVAPPVELIAGTCPRLHIHEGLDDVIDVYLFPVLQLPNLAEHLRHHHLELPPDLRHQRPVVAQRIAVIRRIPLLHRLLAHDAPARLVIVRPEVPLVVHECLRLIRLQRPAVLVHMHQRPLPELRRLRRVNARLFHQIVRHHIAGLLNFPLRGLQLKLRAILQQLLQLLLRDRLAARLPALVLLHPQLLQQLHKLRLEIAPELHLFGRFVILLPVRPNLHLHPLGDLLQQRFHIVRIHIVVLRLVAHINVFPILRRRLLIGNLRNNRVYAERRLRRILHPRLRLQHLPYHPPYLLCLFHILLRRR